MEEKKLLFTVILTSLLLVLSSVDASEVKQTDLEKNNEKLDLEKFQSSFKDIELVIKSLPSNGKGCKECGKQIQNIKINENIENGILVFVSFSMPKESLVELCNEAEKYNATLVIRGIHQNSFTKTKDKILNISPKGLALNIDPELFRKYGIQRVPTFVLIRNGKEIRRLSGNVPLEFAARKLNEVLESKSSPLNVTDNNERSIQ